jgi:hypothetical protein
MTRCIMVTALLCLMHTATEAQWLRYPTPGLPRTADGTPDLTAPAPRTPDGKPDLSGVWRMTGGRYRFNVAADLSRSEILPWARDTSRRWLESAGADRADSLCLPPGPRVAYQATLIKIVQTPGLTLFLYELYNDYFRQIFVDGRSLPTDPNPSWFGSSVGRWDGDTFVVETIGFNGKASLDGFGHPYTEALRTIERYRRRDVGHIDLEITYEDPKAYTRPFTVTQTLLFQPDNELIETVCENERDAVRLVGRSKPPANVRPEILARYAGTYVAGPNRNIMITVDENQLWVEQGGYAPIPLFTESDTVFVLDFPALVGPDEARFTFFSDARENVTHLTWQRQGNTITAPRLTPRTPWGDPDLQGVYTNEDELRVPMERPARFAGRDLSSITADEMHDVARELNESRARNPESRAFGGLSPQRYDLKPSRAWLVVDPVEGRIPPLMPLGEQRRNEYAARLSRVPGSAEDTNLWYRCISIGVPRTMMPTPDGATYRIVQAPGYVAIQYETMHETRIVPLDGRPHIGPAITGYMGDARGHWDGDMLVVETTNIKGQFQTTSAAGSGLRIVERFTPAASGALEWSVTIDDASGWTRPWTFSMPLTRADESQGPLENGCHEGNYVLRNILSAARAEEHQPSER